MVQLPGKKLKEIRESREISLEEIALKTHIRIKYLEAIEEGDTETLPSKAQMRGFLRLYASELGVDLNDLMNKEETSPESENEQEGIEETAVAVENESSGVGSPPPMESPIDPLGKIQDEQTPNAVLPPKDFPATTNKLLPLQFSSVGKQIRERRELLSLSLAEIEKHLHIRHEYLNAIESGKFDQLPSPVQAKGMLVNYAGFLNLDTDQLLLDYAEGLQEKRLLNQVGGKPKQHRSAKTLSKTGLRVKNFFSLDLLFILVIFIAFATFVIWGVNRILADGQTGTTSTDIPEVSDILLATGSPTPLLTEIEFTEEVLSTEAAIENETVVLFTPLPNTNPINIVIIPSQQAWVQITADSEVIFVGRLLPGNAYDYSAEDSLEVLTGNAGALQIYFNEEDIGSAGLFGQVVVLIFTENGLVLPTPTNTPTITDTPGITPSPTITPSPSTTPTTTTFP